MDREFRVEIELKVEGNVTVTQAEIDQVVVDFDLDESDACNAAPGLAARRKLEELLEISDKYTTYSGDGRAYEIEGEKHVE